MPGATGGLPLEEGAATVTVLLQAPATEVFRAFTAPPLLTRWLAESATVEPKVDGRYDLVVRPDALAVSGIFVVWQPDAGLLASWEAPGVEESFVEVVIGLAVGGCDVTLRHRGLPSAAAAADYAERWAAALERLAALFSGAS